MATTYLRTFPVKKEQSYLLKAAGSVSKGNGNDRHMPLGRDGNGDKFRGAMQFSLDFSNMYQIKQAVLVFKSTQEVHVNFGAGPTVQAQRISETWPSGGGSEGNWGTPSGVWPGPGVTGSTYTWGPGGTATGVKRRLDITTLVDQWAPATVLQSSGAAGAAAANYGLRLVAPDEGTTADRYEIHGLRATYPGQRPYIELWYTTDKPPLKPVITAPESDDPAYYASTNANVFYLDFLFSDPDPADTCARTALEVYGDGATDGAPGTLVAGWQPAPTPLGPLNAYRVGIYSAAFVPRTNYRYRLATMDQEATWGPYTPLDEGRIQMVYKVSPPAQLLMTGGLDEPHIYGSLVSADPTDYIGGYDAEVYRDTDAGAIALWSTGQTNVTTSATRQDLTYGGESLRDGEIVRWHLRLANRDGQWSEWSPWQYTEMVATEGPDSCSPADTSTKLTTRTPELTIAHSSDFDGWRYRLYRDGSEIYDSGETAIADTSSTAQTVPADILAWGDGSDSDVPLEWEAQISTVASGAYGPWSPTYAIRINALPAADLTMTPEPTASDAIGDSNPDLWSPYINVDSEAFSEWPESKQIELREQAAVSGPLGPAAGAGTLVEYIEHAHDDTNEWWINEHTEVGLQVDALTSASGWTEEAGIVAATYATPPVTYAGDSLQLTATAVTNTSTDGQRAYKTLDPVVHVARLGRGAVLRCWVRCTSDTNLAQWQVMLGTSDTAWAAYTIFESGDATDTWAEVAIPLLDRNTTDGVFPTSMDTLGIEQDATRVEFGLVTVTGAYTGVLQVRDLRIGVVNDDSTTDGPLTDGDDYEVRARYRDDADAIMTTTLAAAVTATDTNVKLVSVTGITAGDSLTIDTAGHRETRIVSAVGTAGAGGTGVDVTEEFHYGHLISVAAGVYAWGGWSGWETFSYLAPPVVAPDTPADSATVIDPLQELAWTFSSAQAQASAIIRIYERVSSIDYLVWEATQTGTGLTWSLPVGVLTDATDYAWDVTLYDTLGLYATTTRRTFTTDLTPPAELADLVAVADESESSVTLSWTASADTYFDHYRVYWQQADGDWQRIDGGPEFADDDATKLTSASMVHYGARFGANEYAITASNGVQEGDSAYIDVDLAPVRAAWWAMVVPDDTQQTVPLSVLTATRDAAPIVERFTPPGRGSSVHLSWGRGATTLRLKLSTIPGEDGDLAGTFNTLLDSDLSVYVKAVEAWGWDPTYAVVTNVAEAPRPGGLLDLTVTFERTDE